MKLKNLVFFILITFCINPLFAQNSLNDSIANIPIDSTFSILNKRVFLNFPQNTRNTSLTNERLISFSENYETKLTLSVKKAELRFVCREVYALGTKDLLKDVNDVFNVGDQPEFKTEKKDYSNKLNIIQYSPFGLKNIENQIFIDGLIIETADKSLIRIDAYINDMGVPYIKGFKQLTQRIFQSLNKGERLLNMESHETRIPLFQSKTNIDLKIPKDHYLIVNTGEDFNVYQIKKLAPVNIPVKEQIIIYTGLHPSMFYKSMGFKEENKTEVSGKIIEQPITWDEYSNDEKKVYLIEQMIPVGMDSNQVKLHVAVFGEGKNKVSQLKKIIETSKLSFEE